MIGVMKRLRIFLITLFVVCAVGGALIFLRGRILRGTEGALDDAGEVRVDTAMPFAEDGGFRLEEAAESADGETVTAASFDGTEIPEGAAGSVGTNFLGNGCNENRSYVVNTALSGTVTLGFTGDVLLDPEYSIYKTYLERDCDLEACIAPDLLAELKGLDVLTINNEFSYSDRGEPLPGKTYTFRAPRAHVEILKEMGVDIAGIANNHAYDFGEEAFLDTMDTLYEAGIPYAGAGHDLEEAMRPVILYAADMKIGILASTQIERQGAPDSLGATDERPGMLRSWPDVEPTLEAIRRAKEECDFVILLIHWGTESESEIDWCQEEQMPKFVDAGADIIIGAHPHILQKIDWVRGVPVIYSMGNFWFGSKEMDSCVIELTLTEGEMESLRFVPCQQRGCGVRLLKDAEAERLLGYMRRISPGVDIDEEGYITPK